MVFISLVSCCYLSEAQIKEPKANVDFVTKKLEKVNNALQKKIQKIQNKLEKKLQKKFPSLSKLEIDSLVETQNEALLSDSTSSKPMLGKFCEGCPDINTIKQDLQEKINLTPPNLDIGKELNVSIKELDKLQATYEKLNLPSLEQLKSMDVQSMAGEKLPFSEGDLKGLESKAGDLSGLLDEYKQEFEGWEEKLLAQVTSLEEIKLLQEQQKRLASYKPIPDDYYKSLEGMQTNDFVKKQLEAKAEELKKIGGESLQEKFDKAMTEVSKAKKKFPSLENLKDAPKRPPNPLKDEPFVKRLRLGGNIQVNRQNPGSIDFSLKVGYLLNPKAQIGIGSAYRVSTGNNFSSFDFNDDVLTTKMFFDHFIYKSFYVQAVMEWNRTEIKDQDDVSLGTQWVQSGLVGLGKEFKVTKKLKGSMSLLYNFLHDEKSPYQRPVVFRVGFHL